MLKPVYSRMSGWEQAPSPSRVILWNCAIFESYLVMVRCYFLFLFACFLMKAGAQTLPLLPLHAYSHPDTVAKYHLQEVSLFGEDTLFYLAFNADHQLIRQRSGTRDFRYVYVAATKTEEQHFNAAPPSWWRSEEHTSELPSPDHLVCRLLLEKKKNTTHPPPPPY